MKFLNEGFTLIELLAVIIILAIVALIATPIILNVIEDSRDSANMSQAEILYSGAQTLYASGILNDSLSDKFDGTEELYSLLETTNKKPEYGTLKIDSSGKIMFATYIDGKCYSSVEGESVLKVEEMENPLDCAPLETELSILSCNFLEAYVDASSDIIQSDFINEFTIGIRVNISESVQVKNNNMAIFGGIYGSSGFQLSFNGVSNILSESIDYTPYYGVDTDIVVSYNSVTKVKKTYINGELKETLNDVVISAYDKFYIGNSTNARSGSLTGKISDLIIWKKELSIDEISEIDFDYENIVSIENIYKNFNLDSNLSSIGTVVGSTSCEGDLEYVSEPDEWFKFEGGTYISTDVNQSDFAVDGYTIAIKVNINRSEQANYYHMGLYGNHYWSSGISFQFTGSSTSIHGNVDYSSYYDKWTDLVVVHDHKNNVNKLYINGELKRENNQSFTPYSGFYFGTSILSENREGYLYISQARMWDKPLTEDEVKGIDLYSKEAVVAVDDLYRNMNFGSLEEISKFGTIQGSNYYMK